MPKKQQRNAFYFFMKDLEPQLRREGRVFPNGMADVVEIAHPRWKMLPEREKARFEAMAKEAKNKMRGREGDKFRQDNVGNILAHRVDKHTDMEHRRIKERRDMVKDMPPGKDLMRSKFYFISFQILCQTEEKEVLPVEIGMIEYSIAQGITKELHRFIEPGQIPSGYRFTCLQKSEDTHKIPIENFEEASNNYTGLWIQIENFINPGGELPENPPVYCLGAGENWDIVERCLDWIHGKARLGQPNRIRRIYEVESLFQEMHAHVDNTTSKSSLIAALTTSDWDYEPNIKCNHHEKIEVKDCSLGIVKRYAFAISDSVCQYYDVRPTKAHLPLRNTRGSFTVLAPSSMPVCDQQHARLAPKNEAAFKATPKPKVKEDYTELRKPNLPPGANYSGKDGGAGARYPGYPTGGGVSMPSEAPAWSGPMGGAVIQMDYVSRGRGLTVGLQNMKLEGPGPVKHAGRGAPPHPSLAPVPPAAWQVGMQNSQDVGLGRGMTAARPPGAQMQPSSRPPGIPSPYDDNSDDDDDDDDDVSNPLPSPVRLPSQQLPISQPVYLPTQSFMSSQPVYLPSQTTPSSKPVMLPSQKIPSSQPVPRLSQGQSAQTVPFFRNESQQNSIATTEPVGHNGACDDKFFGVEGTGRRGILEKLVLNGRKAGVPVGRGYAPQDWVDDGSLGPIKR